jgi:hypothetical protein
MAPRSPARRGIHTSRAPVAVAAATAAVYAPDTPASRSPSRINAPGCRRDSAARRPSSPSSGPAPPPSASSHWGSVPGAAGSSVPAVLASPRLACVAREKTFRPRLRLALRRRRKTPGASSSDSKPTSSTAGAASSMAYVTPLPSRSTPSPATCEARNAASSAEWTRARKSMSFVPSATRANLA